MQENHSDYETLYALARKLVGHRIFLQGELPNLLVGSLPDNLPFPIPLPDDCRLFGTMTSSQARASGLSNVTVVLETPLSPETVFDFYFVHFTSEGWKMSNPGKKGGGFVEHGFVNDFTSPARTFYRDVGQPTFSVQAVALPASTTEVWLGINDALDSHLSRHLEDQTYGLEMIPPLIAPLGARQSARGGSGGSNLWSTSAVLNSERSTSMLAMHYGAQLEEAGWVRQNAFESDYIAWHTWTITDKDGGAWRGLFYVLKKPDTERDRFLYVEVNLASE